MKLIRGWKTIAFNLAIIMVAQWGDVKDAVLALFGNSANAATALAISNILLRLITVGPVLSMWSDEQSKDKVSSK